MSGWQLYHIAKKYICNGVIDLASDRFQMSLYRDGSNATDLSLVTISDISAGVSTMSMTGTGLVAISGGVRFVADNVTWNTSGGAIDFRFATIANDDGVLLAVTELSARHCDQGHNLTIGVGPAGVFELR
jgi:hypothetical protein